MWAGSSWSPTFLWDLSSNINRAYDTFVCHQSSLNFVSLLISESQRCHVPWLWTFLTWASSLAIYQFPPRHHGNTTGCGNLMLCWGHPVLCSTDHVKPPCSHSFAFFNPLAAAPVCCVVLLSSGSNWWNREMDDGKVESRKMMMKGFYHMTSFWCVYLMNILFNSVTIIKKILFSEAA